MTIAETQLAAEQASRAQDWSKAASLWSKCIRHSKRHQLITNWSKRWLLINNMWQQLIMPVSLKRSI